MAQGSLALVQKNINMALTMLQESAKISNNTDDKEQEQVRLFDLYAKSSEEELPF